MSEFSAYSRSDLKIGILHIGLGRFHRAHQAYYTDLLLEKDFGPWGIMGVSLNTKGAIEKLRDNNGLYDLKIHSESKNWQRTIGCLCDFAFLKEESEKIYNSMASESIKIVSLTITEKGYHFDSASGGLNFESDDIQFDFLNKEKPRSAIGVLAQGLWRRYQAGERPLSIISCDNIQKNGELLYRVLNQFVAQAYKDDGFTQYIKGSVSFPSTMVDRIVPATENGLIETEEFSQWVIENNVKNERPAWEKVGVLIVKDVKVYEKLKLSLLNATHSYLAYFGSLKGYTYVNEAILDQEIMDDLLYLMKQELPCYIEVPEEFDLEIYCESLLSRFKNPNLKHKLLQISMDGSVKIPQRWVPSLQFNIKNKLSVKTLAKALSAWHLFCIKAQNHIWELNDPMKHKILESLGGKTDIIHFYTQLSQVLPESLLKSEELSDALRVESKDMSKRFL